MNCAFGDGQIAPATRRFFRHQSFAALALAGVICAPAAARSVSSFTPVIAAGVQLPASPALWEVRDGDTIIYLFGTFHTLDDRTRWFDRSVRAAFEQSGELVLETIVPEDPAQVRAIGRAVIGPAPDANSFLGQTRNVVERGRADGLSVDRGADAVLRRAASDQGKSLAGIELFADQLRTFSRIAGVAPAPTPPPPPASSVAPITLLDLLAAWKAGDTRAFSTMLSGFEATSPAAYQSLITDRNALFGAWIARRLAQPGTVFVAVGSGHLAGKDSVQNWLFAKGIVAHRIA